MKDGTNFVLFGYNKPVTLSQKIISLFASPQSKVGLN
jgi:hypothetical protein